MSVLAPPSRWREALPLSSAASRPSSGYAILLPTLAIILVFRFLPMLQAFYISLHEYDLIRPAAVHRAGELHRPLPGSALPELRARISIAYVVFSCVPVWVLSLALAVLFNREIRAKNLFRSAAFMPVVMPVVVNAVVWTFMYHQDGVVNTILGWFGIDPIPWLRSSRWALWADHHHRHLARDALLHGHLPRRPPGDPQRVLRGGARSTAPRPGPSSGTSPCRCSSRRRCW